MVGKWHLGFDWTFKAGNDASKLLELKPDSKQLENLVDYTQAFKGGPIDCGFDSFYGMVASPGMPPYTYLEDDKVTVLPTAKQEWFGPRNDFPAGKKLDYERKQQMLRPGLKAPDFTSNKVMMTYTEKSVEFIDNYESKKPFFLYIPYASPHTPIFPREEFIGKSKAGIYGDFVQELDWSVGQIIKSLAAKGFLDNTVVIFTADNGWAKGSFPLSFREQFNHNPSRNYNGYKASLLEGGHRVPFIVHWPKTIKAKSQCDTMISTNDLYATCAAITDSTIAANQGVDSYNMLGLIQGKTEHERNNLVMADYSGKMAIRKGDWKLILNPNPKQRQLFNLAKDVSETTNLYNNPEFKSVEAELMKEITTLIKNGRSTAGPTQTNDGEPIWKQLYWMK
jgi:arylsulfatase A